MYTAYLRVEL